VSTEQLLAEQINTNDVLVYMKGSPQFPMCGFSGTVASILMKLNTKFSYVNILEHPQIRSTLPKVANWPTFPQLYINGELIGGCDIVVELYEAQDLEKLLQAAGAVMPQKPEYINAIEIIE